MGISRGNITTNIIKSGLVFNMDPANRASTIPSTSTDKTFNTVDTSISGSFASTGMYDSSMVSPSFDFDGVSNRITISDSNFVQNTLGSGSISVNIWTYKDASETDYVFDSTNGSGGFQGISLIIDSSQKAYFIRITENKDFLTGYKTIGFTTGAWHNIVGVANTDSNTWALYLDGVHKFTGNAITGQTNSPGYNLTFGGKASSWSYEGNIGCTQIYNRALSANEVLHNYNALKGRFI
tara:strand:- start:1206 stop:1919 length:714 start_codon:yes stop_codon:yes gene_type:complete